MAQFPKVLMTPDYRLDNPYQSLLTQSLKQQLITVDFPQGYRRGLPLWRAVQLQQAHVLHLHWLTPYLKGEHWLSRCFYSLKFLLDLWLISLSGIPIIWTIHNDLSHDAQFPRLERWVRSGLKQIVSQTIVHHRQDTSALTSEPLNHHVIPHGHYRDIYAPALEQSVARQKLNLPQDGRLYLNLGMIRPYKGLENLLSVWQENLEFLVGDHLLIAGKALDSDYADRIFTQALSTPQVTFQPGFIPAEQIHLYFSAADIVILPFRQILTSGSLILAMSYAKPVIAPRQKSLVETMIGATDLLYDPGDPLGLAKAIKLSSEQDLKSLCHQVKLACDRLEWSKIAQQTAQVYQYALNALPRNSPAQNSSG